MHFLQASGGLQQLCPNLPLGPSSAMPQTSCSFSFGYLWGSFPQSDRAHVRLLQAVIQGGTTGTSLSTSENPVLLH